MGKISSDQLYQSAVEGRPEGPENTESALPQSQKMEELLGAIQEGTKAAAKEILPSQLQEPQERVICAKDVKETLQQPKQAGTSAKVAEVARESQIVPALSLTEDEITDYIKQENNEPFKMAVKNGDQKMVGMFLKILDSQCVDRDRYLNGALLIAAEVGHVEIVKELLEFGSDRDESNKSFRTPLIIAAQNGHKEIVRLLIESAHSEMRSGYGKMRSNSDVLEFMHKTDLSDKSALMLAVEAGHKDIVELLLAETLHLVGDNQGEKEKWMNRMASVYMLALIEGREEVTNSVLEVVKTEGLST